MVKKTIFGLLILVITGYSPASTAMTINWQDEAFTGTPSNSDFDDGFITFTPFLADRLDDISGSGYYHNHANTRTFDLSLMLDGIWTSIFSHTVPASTTTPFFLSDIPTAVGFAQSLVSGIRLSVDQPVGFAFHAVGIGLGTQFVFSNSAVSVAEPGMIALLGTGLLGLGLTVGRRRQD